MSFLRAEKRWALASFHGSFVFTCLVLGGIAGCSEGDGKTATQVVAQVNGEEISVHQLNFVLQRAAGAPAERAAGVRKTALERLIEQEVLVQAADAARLERQPEVLQKLEAGRREILARAHLDKIASAIPRPEPSEVSAFFQSNPQLFAQRKVYQFSEIALPGLPLQWEELEKALLPTASIHEAAQVLRKHGINAPIASNAVRASEHLPLAILPGLEKSKLGDVVIYPRGQGIVVAQIDAIRAEPVDEKRAGPVIEQFLLNRRRQEAVQAEIKRLRTAAQVAYKGEFEEAAVAEANETTTSPVVPSSATTTASTSDPSLPPAAAAGPGASDASVETGIDKGLKGLR